MCDRVVWLPRVARGRVSVIASLDRRVSRRWSILAHPSTTFLQKPGFRVEGVHLGTDADAHPPHENTVFAQKMWKGVPKTPPRTTRVHEKETTTTNSTI